MLTSIKGKYEEGKLTLLEPAPPVDNADVIITFLEDEIPKKKRMPGGLLRLTHLKGKPLSLPDDFNEPLEDLKDYM